MKYDLFWDSKYDYQSVADTLVNALVNSGTHTTDQARFLVEEFQKAAFSDGAAESFQQLRT